MDFLEITPSKLFTRRSQWTPWESPKKTPTSLSSREVDGDAVNIDNAKALPVTVGSNPLCTLGEVCQLASSTGTDQVRVTLVL